MKTLFLSVLLTYVLVGFSTTYEWKGTTNSDYQNPTNWFPIRSEKKQLDTLVFAEKSIVTNVKNEVVSQIEILDTISFQATENIEFKTNYLFIPFSNTLTLTGEYSIELSIQKKALIQGKFILDGKSDLKHRLLGQYKQSIVFDSLAVCQVNNLNGNLFGKKGSKEVVIFKNGATYYAKDGGNPFAYSAPYTKVIFEPQSVYIHEHGYAPSLGGRKYGQFILNYDSDVSINFGSDYQTIIDKLILKKGSININTQTNTKALNLKINEWKMYPNTSFVYNPSFLSEVELLIDTLPIGCEFGKSVTIKVFSDTLFLQEDLTIEGKLELNGIINTNSYQVNIKNTDVTALTFDKGFIQGECTRYIGTNNTYEFPVGKDSIQLAKITTNDLEGVEYITSEFIQTNLPFSVIKELENTEEFLNHGYWKITPNKQPTQGTYDIELTAKNYTNNLESKELRIVKRESALQDWKHQGIYQSGIAYQNHVIISYNKYTSFSHFAIIEGKGIVLPLVLKKFQVEEHGSEYKFHWEMYDEEEGLYQIKMSEDGINYQTILKVPVTNDIVYNTNCLKRKANYFQLCHNNDELMTIYQKYQTQGVLYPNPSKDEAFLLFENEYTGWIFIYDLVGQKQYSKEVENCTKITLPVLPLGSYIVKFGTNSQRWIIK